MTAVRRSARTRHQATSIYDEAKKAIDEKDTSESAKKNDDGSDTELSSHGDKSDAESEAEAVEEEEEEPASDDNESSDEEDFQPKAPAKKPRSAQKKKKQAPKKTQIKIGREKPATKKSKATGGGTQTTTRRGIQSALTSLSKKVLDETESPETSMVAALLQSYKGTSSNKASQGTSIYTPQLETIARRVLQEQKDDPNKAQTQLMNLLFRSVGGSVDTNLDSEKSVLEEMDNEEWASVVTDLVDEMRHTPPDRILFCADPKGAVHAANVASGKEVDTSDAPPSSLGVREFRKIYEEFWYILGTVALTEGVASKETVEDSDDDDDDSTDGEQATTNRKKHNASFTTTSLFDAEVVRDLILRVTELITVGQPDVRAAATVAALQLGHAVLDRTVQLGAKLQVATRQYEAATKNNKESKKAASFRHQMDSLKRTKADLEEMIHSAIIQGVFMHRYRDSNLFIRATAIDALSKMTLQRPDLFLVDKYLKYFGWMIADKAATVRAASLAGLHAPFVAAASQKTKSSKIDVQQLENVIGKFITKLADCVHDVNPVVQEQAMSLLLDLERNGFLDEVDNDNLWSQINLVAISPHTTPKVRKESLYFVMDQLEAFDEEDEEAGQKRKRKDKASLAESSERLMVQRIDALASWVGENLVDGTIPIDKIRVHLADYIVESLREMPEHKALVTNWDAMLRAIGDDNSDGTESTRAEVAKQRVLVQMLARAAQAEVVAVSQGEFMGRDVDPDVAEVEAEENAAVVTTKPKKGKGGKSKAYSAGTAHETLSVSLLLSLPDLLIKFKGDPTILGSITLLPRYILPTVFSLSQRKKDVLALTKNLADIYLESSDEFVLQNIALSLQSLSQGGHTRAADARLQLQRVASTLVSRLIELLAEEEDKKGAGSKRKSPRKSKKPKKRAKRSSDDSLSSADSDDEDEANSESNDTEYAIRSCLRRLRILSKRCNLAELLDESALEDDSAAGGTIGDLCDAVVTGIEKRLKERAVKVESANNDGSDDEEEEPNVTVPEIWKSGDQSIHSVVAESVKDSLDLLLSITAWKLFMAEKESNVVMQKDDDIVMEKEDEEDDDTDEFGVVRQRDQLVAILVLCFEQFLPPVADPSEDEPLYTKEHVSFADQVQGYACQVAGDIRSLFPKEWAEASSPLLRACALTDDQNVAGGLVRYFRSKEMELRNEGDQDEEEDSALSKELLLPLGRSVATNWKLGNRREAGVALAHVTGSGAEAGKIVLSLSRVLKKIDSVRLLEAHMASLRQGYEEWMLNEPEEPQSDRPTDEEMAAFADAEKKHDEEFQLLEQQAARLSSTLGVGKLSDSKLAPSLLGFLRNGVRFAFSHDDGELVLGSRLSFLSVLSKYASWIRKNNEQKDVLRMDLEDAELELREHDDFHEVHEDDLKALASFRSALGIKEATRQTSSPRSVTDDSDRNSVGDEYSDEGDSVTRASVGTNRSRQYGGASVSSVRSKLSSAPGSLSPLYEEDASEEESPEDDASAPSAKRRKGARLSVSSQLTASTMGQSHQPTIEEGSGESEASDDGSY